MKIAICAYGAWARAEHNPPELILNQLQSRPNLLALCVPVDGAALRPMLENLLDQEQPGAIIGIGLAAGSSVIQFESTAINMLDYGVPDASGAQPHGESICDGPVAYRSNLPNQALVESVQAAHIPARISHAAGTHCCNQMLYLARHLSEQRGLQTQCGFIHVPYTHRHIAEGSVPEQASMALKTMVQAVELTIDTLQSGSAYSG